MSQMVYPDEAYFLWKISWMSLLSSFYAGYRGYWQFVTVPTGVFATSLLYWGKPHVAWRRRLDMTYVISSLLFQNYMAWGSEYAIPFYAVSLITYSFYPLGIHLFRAGRRWESIYAHATMHLLANVCNCILYSGELAGTAEGSVKP